MVKQPKQQTAVAVTVSAVEHQQRHKVFQNVSKIINFLNFLWTSLRALLFLFTSILLKIIFNHFTGAHWILFIYVYIICGAKMTILRVGQSTHLYHTYSNV